MVPAAPANHSMRRYRTLTIVLVVLVLHALVLWVLQTGLLVKLRDVMVPVFLEQVAIRPEQPALPPPPPPERTAAPPPRTLQKPRVSTEPPPVPQQAPAAAPAAPPLPVATTAPTAQPHVTAAPAAAPIAPPVPPAPVPAAPPAAQKVELPSSNADYLDNPRPAYPATSRRFGEQGVVQLRVYISAEGLPARAEVRQSSGYERLDQAAIATVLKWRFVPGKRGGVPEAMWVTVPINFVLE